MNAVQSYYKRFSKITYFIIFVLGVVLASIDGSTSPMDGIPLSALLLLAGLFPMVSLIVFWAGRNHLVFTIVMLWWLELCVAQIFGMGIVSFLQYLFSPEMGIRNFLFYLVAGLICIPGIVIGRRNLVKRKSVAI